MEMELFTVAELREFLINQTETLVNECYNVVGLITALNTSLINEFVLLEISEFNSTIHRQIEHFCVSTKIIYPKRENDTHYSNNITLLKISTLTIMTNLTRKLIQLPMQPQPFLTFITTPQSQILTLNTQQVQQILSLRTNFTISRDCLTTMHLSTKFTQSEQFSTVKFHSFEEVQKIVEQISIKTSNEPQIRHVMINIRIRIISYLSHALFRVQIIDLLDHDHKRSNHSDIVIVLSHIHIEDEIQSHLVDGATFNLLNVHIVCLEDVVDSVSNKVISDIELHQSLISSSAFPFLHLPTFVLIYSLTLFL